MSWTARAVLLLSNRFYSKTHLSVRTIVKIVFCGGAIFGDLGLILRQKVGHASARFSLFHLAGFFFASIPFTEHLQPQGGIQSDNNTL